LSTGSKLTASSGRRALAAPRGGGARHVNQRTDFTGSNGANAGDRPNGCKRRPINVNVRHLESRARCGLVGTLVALFPLVCVIAQAADPEVIDRVVAAAKIHVAGEHAAANRGARANGVPPLQAARPSREQTCGSSSRRGALLGSWIVRVLVRDREGALCSARIAEVEGETIPQGYYPHDRTAPLAERWRRRLWLIHDEQVSKQPADCSGSGFSRGRDVGRTDRPRGNRGASNSG
jgi:hypothetical protein